MTSRPIIRSRQMKPSPAWVGAGFKRSSTGGGGEAVVELLEWREGFF